MKKILFCVLTIVLLLSMIGCGEGTSLLQPGVAFSEKERDTAPDVPAADLTELVDGNSDFAFNLYQQLKEAEEGNLFYSPYSISLALAMTYAGARGETAEQMAETLRFLLPSDQLHPAFNSLDLELNSRGEGAQGKDGEGFRLNIVNETWGQQDYEFLAEFLDTLAENYGAGMRLLDFINFPEESRVTINDWVEEQTEDRIKDLIPQGAIDAITRLVLTNAIYFNAAWAYPFEEEMTDEGTFNLLDGGDVTVPMMNQTESFGYVDGDGYQAVEMPYDGMELSMVILLPDTDEFEAVESSINSQLIAGIVDDIEYKEVALTMPKFEFESDFSLVNTLAAMGMPIAFSSAADFSGMTGARDLTIGEIIHKSFVSVDEAGTEAAAATAVLMELTAMPELPVEVTIDRPFIFMIRDLQTDAILFVGRVMDPSA